MKSIFILLFLFVNGATYGQGSGQLENLARAILTDMEAGNTEKVYERFEDNMKSGISPKHLSILWKGMEDRYGKYEKAEKPVRTVAGDAQFVSQTCTFGNTKVDFRVKFNSQSEIESLFFAPPK
jgi:hypothetical protein